MIEANLDTAFKATTGRKPIAPLEIVRDPHVSTETKRGLLASWASDARAVPNCPALRRLDDGNLVLIDDVLDALKLLDGDPTSGTTRDRNSVAPLKRGHWSRLARRWRSHRDDDDDPPPAPASIAPLDPITGGTLAVAA